MGIYHRQKLIDFLDFESGNFGLKIKYFALATDANRRTVGEFYLNKVGLDDLGLPCSPRDPRFASSNPAEVDGFFHDVKILSTSPPGGTFS